MKSYIKHLSKSNFNSISDEMCLKRVKKNADYGQIAAKREEN